jgi:hypothetical protein
MLATLANVQIVRRIIIVPLKKLLSAESIGAMFRRRDQSYVKVTLFLDGLIRSIRTVDSDGVVRWYPTDGCHLDSKHPHDYDITNYSWKRGF